jgi:hypothetical protein
VGSEVIRVRRRPATALSLGGRAMLHPNLAPSIILDKKSQFSESWLGDAELAFVGNMFSPSVILASNAVAGLSGRLGEDSEDYVPPTQFNGSLAEDECLTNFKFAHCATLMLSDAVAANRNPECIWAPPSGCCFFNQQYRRR